MEATAEISIPTSEPMPPLRYNRKLARWMGENFDPEKIPQSYKDMGNDKKGRPIGPRQLVKQMVDIIKINKVRGTLAAAEPKLKQAIEAHVKTSAAPTSVSK